MRYWGLSCGIVHPTSNHHGWQTSHEYLFGNGLAVSLYSILMNTRKSQRILDVHRMVFKWFNTFRVRAGLKEQPTNSQAFRSQWAKDYQLVAWGSEALFAEYLEMGKRI